MPVEDWQVRAYSENVHHLAQEMTNKLMGTTREKTANAVMIGFSNMSPSEGVEPTSRFAPTPNTTPDRGRRWAFPAAWVWNALEDQNDAWETIHLATNEFAVAGAGAYNRLWNKRILDAAVGPAADGNEGALTLVPLPASQIIADGSTGLLSAKLIEALSRLQKATGGDLAMYGPTTIVYNPDDLRFLLTDPDLTTIDKVDAKSLMSGKAVPGLLGIDNWVMSDQTPQTGDIGSVVVYARLGMGVGRNTSGKKTRQDERADLSYTEQIFMQDKFNAVRADDKLVIQINVDRTALTPTP